MKPVLDKLVDFAKKLPGFGLVFLIVTLAYAYLKERPGELTLTESFSTAFMCWLIYHASALLDLLYDLAYGPESKLHSVWKFCDLQKARNSAAAVLFGPIDERVKDYSGAEEYKYVGDEKPLQSLYFYCSTVAKPTNMWVDKIAPKIHVSKAARTLFVFALVAALMVEVKVLRDAFGLPTFADRLGLLSNVWLLFTIAFLAFVVFVALRVLHNIQLFEYVASEVVHVPKKNNKQGVVIFEVTLPEKTKA